MPAKLEVSFSGKEVNSLQKAQSVILRSCLLDISGALTHSLTLISPAGTPPGPYWVLSSDYVGHSLVYGCRDFGLFRMEFSWILSREPTLSEETLEGLHGILTSIGVDVSKMVPTNQDPEYCSAMDQ